MCRPVLCTLLSVSILLSACHKSVSHASGFSGDWLLVQLNGGPSIDVIPVDREHVSILRLLPDSTRQDIYNGKVISTGTWSVKPYGSPMDPSKILTFGDSSYFVYRAWLSDNKLIIKIEPDIGYQATYTRR